MSATTKKNLMPQAEITKLLLKLKKDDCKHWIEVYGSFEIMTINCCC